MIAPSFIKSRHVGLDLAAEPHAVFVISTVPEVTMVYLHQRGEW